MNKSIYSLDRKIRQSVKPKHRGTHVCLRLPVSWVTIIRFE